MEHSIFNGLLYASKNIGSGLGQPDGRKAVVGAEVWPIRSMWVFGIVQVQKGHREEWLLLKGNVGVSFNSP